MEFFEVVVALAAVLGLPYIVIYNVRRMVEARSKAKLGGDEKALRASELEAMIENAVERAVRPMQERIEDLESGLPPAKLTESGPVPLLDLPKDDPANREEEIVGGRARTRG